MKKIEVTVLVLCYNSGNTVIETLESVRHQTYPYIHLVVSDDSSEDNTFEKVKRWEEKYSARFITSKILRTKRNLGVSRHMNSCMDILETEWFKGLAADDILLPDCIEKYVDFLKTHYCRGMIYAKHLMFNRIKDKNNYWIDYEEMKYQRKFGTLSAQEQRKSIAKREVLCSPTCFTNKKDIMAAGGYDLRIKNVEDWPIKMRLLDKNFKMTFMDEYTVLYRVSNSISRSDKVYFKPDLLRMEKIVKEIYCYPIARNSFLYRWNEGITNLRYWVIIKICGNRRTPGIHLISIFLGLFNIEKMKKAIINIIYKNKSKKMVEEVLANYKNMYNFYAP